MSRPSVHVVGGAVAGLAAAERLSEFADVTLTERQPYDEKRVNCGEAINDAPLVPLDATPENGFVNDVEGFTLEIYPDTDHDPDERPLGRATLPCDAGYICDRNVVERRWAERLDARGVDVRDDTAVGTEEYRAIQEEYDYVIDATGQPSLTVRALDLGRDVYTGDMVALNADVEGSFSDHESHPQIYFEGYTGYAWSFPKSSERSNVGIGWAGDERPGDYYEALEGVCRRNDLPVPDRADVNIYTIPRGPSLDPERAYVPEHDTFLVGDAAGIANRYQGEGICQAIRSSSLVASLIETGREDQYPRRLYDLMKSEYRLAHLMRGTWVEHRDPELLAAVTEAIDGLTIDEVTRQPRAIMRRLARRPAVAAKLLANEGMLRRFYAAYTDRWEYDAAAGSAADETAA